MGDSASLQQSPVPQSPRKALRGSFPALYPTSAIRCAIHIHFAARASACVGYLVVSQSTFPGTHTRTHTHTGSSGGAAAAAGLAGGPGAVLPQVGVTQRGGGCRGCAGTHRHWASGRRWIVFHRSLNVAPNGRHRPSLTPRNHSPPSASVGTSARDAASAQLLL